MREPAELTPGVGVSQPSTHEDAAPLPAKAAVFHEQAIAEWTTLTK